MTSPTDVHGRVRVVIEQVEPSIDGGRFPIKRTPGEAVQVTADIFADGHDVLGGVVRYRALPDNPDGQPGAWAEAPLRLVDNDRWTGRFTPGHVGRCEFTIEAWVDAFASWRSALVRRVAASQVAEGDVLEGAALVRAAAARAEAVSPGDAEWLSAMADRLAAAGDAEARARTALGEDLLATLRRYPDREHATSLEGPLPVLVERERARVGAWYEMFPRSTSPVPGRSGTFRDAEARLPAIAAMGFDVLYLPPIHPIGTTARKGPGNNPVAAPGDPGSPWAIGSPDGGHMAVEPGLGTLEDFDRFAAAARDAGLEIALDIAYQCSPDHPYVTSHPEWFRHRPDGSIKYAENPPKKYQDIFPIDFDSAAWPALWKELADIVRFWAARGVRIFRVDNPHTKPFAFWEWMIGTVREEYPDAIFLSEAFTRPKVMKRLAKLGFSQSYTYFTWRNTKEELTEYFTELTRTSMREYFRPNLFANTPDILHAYLQEGGRAAFQVRLLLAGMLGASYGIYSGFELCEGRAVPGSEEYLDSEKYDYKQWDWDRPGHITDLVATVNRIRRAEPALQVDSSLAFHETDNPHIIAFSKTIDGEGVLVIVNLDPLHLQHGWVRVPLDLFGLDPAAPFDVVDQLDGIGYTWTGELNYVRFDPAERVAHVLKPVVPPPPPELEVAPGSHPLDEAPRAIIEERLLLPYLSRQRWFGAKARPIAGARFVDWAPIGSGTRPAFLTIVEVSHLDGSTDLYQVPLAVLEGEAALGAERERPESVLARLSGGERLCDAIMDDEACRAIADLAHRGGAIQALFGTIEGEPVGGEAAGAVSQAARITRLPGTHSNSAITLDDRYVLKLFRRLEDGLNPDVEIGRYLALADDDVHVPALTGVLGYRTRDGEASTLAFVQVFLAGRASGWDHALAHLSGFFERVRRAPGESHPSVSAATLPADLGSVRPPDRMRETIGDYLRVARTLGLRTASLHRALAANLTDEAFVPQPASAADVTALTSRMREDAKATLDLLARQTELDPAAAELARQVLASREALLAGFDVPAKTMAGFLRTRIHGDYHLGQVLIAEDDVAIIDFEGEPSRSLSDRRRRQSPLRDVAGMLRSLSYAAYAGLAAAAGDDEHARQALQPWADAWRAWTGSAFLAGYIEGASGATFLPLTAKERQALLDLFVRDKAFYELHYELNSRPAWVSIPLTALRDLAGAAPPGSPSR